MAKKERLLREVQCVFALASESEKLRERVLALETASHAKVSKGGKLPKTRSNRGKVDVALKVE